MAFWEFTEAPQGASVHTSGTTFLEPVTFFRSLALRPSESYIPLWGWCGDRLTMSRPTFFLCLPPPAPPPPGQAGVGPTLLLPLLLFSCLGQQLWGAGGGYGKASSPCSWKDLMICILQDMNSENPPSQQNAFQSVAMLLILTKTTLAIQSRH